MLHWTQFAVHDDAAAEQLLSELPWDFPTDLKMQVAKLASKDLALKIYGSISTRDAKFERARLMDDKPALWALVRERKDDDVGLLSAHLLSPTGLTPQEMIEIAETFVAHRQFDFALALYRTASSDPSTAAESRYQIARIHFLSEDFHAAIEAYRALAKDFAGTDWEKNSNYQIASCYWRLGDYNASEKAYLAYIAKYGADEGAVRNVVDVYRVLGDNTKALATIERALARRPSASNRQVFLFTKAKILYTQKKYTAAAELFHKLTQAKIKSAPGGTTKEEARYFEALSLSKTANSSAATAIWRDLATPPLSYYGIRAAEKLGQHIGMDTPPACPSDNDRILAAVETDISAVRRPLRAASESADDAVSELIFLQLWDEASIWKDRSVTRAEYRQAAELAYAAGRYHRAISYADRLLKSDASVMGLLYPAGFREQICREAGKYKLDPDWLHAIIWQESKYDPDARSGASARGLMQFIPETAAAQGAAIGISEFSLDRLYEPEMSIRLGAHYWASLLGELKSPVLALAAYNGGIDNVRRWKAKWPEGDDEFFVSDIGFAETKGTLWPYTRPGPPTDRCIDDNIMRRQSVFFAVLFAAVGLLAIVIMQPFLTYIVLAAILTYALFPVYRSILNRLHRPDVSSTIAILISLLLMVLPAVFLASELVQQMSGVYTNLQIDNIQRVADYLSGLTGNRVDFQGMLTSSIDQIRRTIVGLAPDIIGSVGEISIGLVIMLFVMFYGFTDGERFLARVKELLPLDPDLKESLFYEVRTITQAVLYGQVMTALIQGTLGAIGLLIFGIQNWIFWGAIMIIMAFLPVLGTPIIWVPAAVGLILDGETVRGIGLLIFGSVLVVGIDNFFRPRLVSGRTKVHPVLILIGVLGGLKIFGFAGMLVGPLILALLVALIKFYEQSYLRSQ